MDAKIRGNLIVEIVQKVTSGGIKLGKIQLQKLIYFLQERGIPLNYKFRIYHYGPYSFGLSSDLDSLDSLKILCVKADSTGYGYQIEKGECSEDFYDKDTNIAESYKNEIDFVLTNFSQCDTSEIELRATTHYVYKNQKKTERNTSKENVVNVVKQLKPRFTDEKIASTYDELNTIIPLK